MEQLRCLCYDDKSSFMLTECYACSDIIEVKRNGACAIVDNGNFSRSTLVPPIKMKKMTRKAVL